MADALDACLIQQNYSRLVIDCNRPPGAASSIPVLSEATRIPGNEGLSAVEAEAREADAALREIRKCFAVHLAGDRRADDVHQADGPRPAPLCLEQRCQRVGGLAFDFAAGEKMFAHACL